MIPQLALLAALIATAYGAPANPCDNQAVRAFARVNNKFGNDLLQELGKHEGNVFFSPNSISSVLSAAFFGARGKTQRALLEFGYLTMQYLNISAISPVVGHCIELLTTLKSTSDEYALERANAMLSQKDYPILDEYKYTLSKFLGAVLKEVDFAQKTNEAVEEINSWVKEKTHGKISKLVDELDESTRLLLLSAIYFKGTWETEFDPKNTKLRPFYNNGLTSPKSVPTMWLTSTFPYVYDTTNEFRALKLPYKGNDISMLILLPFERDGIEKLQRSITYETLIDIFSRVKETEVDVYLPKFKIEFSNSLKDDLTRAGLGEFFSTNADFSGITGNKDLYVSDVIHKAIVEVNEEGSEAAAVTGGIMVPLSLQIPWNQFRADHPFLFYIIDNRSGSNLFIGRVNEL